MSRIPFSGTKSSAAAFTRKNGHRLYFRAQLFSYCDISVDDLMMEISELTKGFHVTQYFLTCNCGKVVFTGDALPSHVKLGLVRYPVCPFMPRATQCQVCWVVGAMIEVYINTTVFSRCGGPHDQDCCITEVANCVNCHGTMTPCHVTALVSRRRQRYSNGCLATTTLGSRLQLLSNTGIPESQVSSE